MIHKVILIIGLLLSSTVMGQQLINISMEQNIIEPFLKKMLNARIEYVKSNPDFVIRVESDTEERSKRVSDKFPYFVFGKALITFIEHSNDKEFFSTQPYIVAQSINQSMLLRLVSVVVDKIPIPSPSF